MPTDQDKQAPPASWLQRKHGADAIRAASPAYNRWIQVAPPVATMLCLGGMYSWSLYNGPLTHDLGIIAQVAGDWPLTSVVPVFGTLVFCNGVAGAVLGKWIDRSGPRIAYGVGGTMYGGGLMLGSLGVATHSLPLLYAGFGIIGGLGHVRFSYLHTHKIHFSFYIFFRESATFRRSRR